METEAAWAATNADEAWNGVTLGGRVCCCHRLRDDLARNASAGCKGAWIVIFDRRTLAPRDEIDARIRSTVSRHRRLIDMNSSDFDAAFASIIEDSLPSTSDDDLLVARDRIREVTTRMNEISQPVRANAP